MNRGNMSLFKKTEYGGYSAPRRPVWRQGYWSRTARKSCSSRPEIDAIDDLPDTLLLGQQNNDMSWYPEPHHPQHYQQYPQQPYGNQFQHSSQYQHYSPPDNKENTCDRNDLRYYMSPRINANRRRSWSPDHRRHSSSTPSKWNRRHEDISIERGWDRRRRRSPRRRRSSKSPRRYKSRSRSRSRSRTRSHSRSPHQRRKRSSHRKRKQRSQSSSSRSESVTSVVASDSSVLLNTFPKRRKRSERWQKRQPQSFIKKIHHKHESDYQSGNPYKWVNPELKFNEKETPTVEVTVDDLLMSPISSEDFSQRSGEADSEGENEEIDIKAQKTDTINKEEEKQEIGSETQNMDETNMEGEKEEINSKILKKDKAIKEMEKKEIDSKTLKTDQANKEGKKKEIDSKRQKIEKSDKEGEKKNIDSKSLKTDKANKEGEKEELHSKILKKDKANKEVDKKEIDTKTLKTDKANKEGKKKEIGSKRPKIEKTDKEGESKESDSKSMKTDDANKDGEKEEIHSKILIKDKTNKEEEKKETDKTTKEGGKEKIHSKILKKDKANKEVEKKEIDTKTLKTDKANKEGENIEIDGKRQKIEKADKEGEKKEIHSESMKTDKANKKEEKGETDSKILKNIKANKQAEKKEIDRKTLKTGKANKEGGKKEIDGKRQKIEKAHKVAGNVEMEEMLEDKTKNEIVSSVKICRYKSNLEQGSIEKLKETLQKTKSNTQMIDRVLSILPNKEFKPDTERAKNSEVDTFESESKEHAKKLKLQIEKPKDNDNINNENDSSVKIFRGKSSLGDNRHDNSRQEKHKGMSKDKKASEKTKDEQTNENMPDRKHNAISEMKKYKEKSKHDEKLNGKKYKAKSNEVVQTKPLTQEIDGPSPLKSDVVGHSWLPISPEIKELQSQLNVQNIRARSVSPEICKSPPNYMSQSSKQNVSCNFSDRPSRTTVPVKQNRFLVSEPVNTTYSQNSNNNRGNSDNSKKIKDSDKQKGKKMPPKDLNQSRSYLLSLEEKKGLFEAHCSKVKKTVEKEKKPDSERKVTMVKDSIDAMRENKEKTLKTKNFLDKIDLETLHKKNDIVVGAHKSVEKMPNMQRERKSFEAKQIVHDQSCSHSSFEEMSIQRERRLSGVMEATPIDHDKVLSHSNGDNGGISNPESKMTIPRERNLSGVKEAKAIAHDKVLSHSNCDNGGTSNSDWKMKSIPRERRLSGVKEAKAIAHDKVSSHSKCDNGGTSNSDWKMKSIPRERQLSGVKETTAIAHDNMSSHSYGNNGSTRTLDGKMTSIPRERLPSRVKETTPIVQNKVSSHSNGDNEGSSFNSVEKMRNIPRERHFSGVKETTPIVHDIVSSHSNGDNGSTHNLDAKIKDIPRERRLSGVKETIPIVHDKVSSQNNGNNEGSTSNSVENMRGIPRERKLSGVNDISSNAITRKRRASSDTVELSSPTNSIKQSPTVITGRMNRPSGDIFIPLGKQLDKKQKMMNVSPALTERQSYVTKINQKSEQNAKRCLFSKNKKRISRWNDFGTCNTSQQTKKSPPTTSNKHPFKQFPLNRTGRKVSPGKKLKSAFDSPIYNIFEKMGKECLAIKRTNETTLDQTYTNEKRRKRETEDNSKETVKTLNDREKKTTNNYDDSEEKTSKNNDDSEDKTSENNDDSEEKTSKTNDDSEEKTSENNDDSEEKTSKNNEERSISNTSDCRVHGEIDGKLCKSIEKTRTKEIAFEEKTCAKEEVGEENDFSKYDDDSDIEPIEMIGSVYIKSDEDDLSNLAVGEGEHIRYGDDRIVLQELGNDSDTKDIEDVDSKDIEDADSKNIEDVDSLNIEDIDVKDDVKDIENVDTMDETPDINDVGTKDADTTDVDTKDDAKNIKDSDTKDIVDGKAIEPLKSTPRRNFSATLEVLGKLWEEENETENEVQVTIISPKKCPVINDAESSDDDGDLEFSSGVELSPIKSADKSFKWLKMAKEKLKVPVGLSKIQLDQDPDESHVDIFPELQATETFSKKIFAKGFVVEHTKLLKTGYTEKTLAHLYPKKLYRTSQANMKNLGKCLLCRTCSMYFSPLVFTAHHDTNNVMTQIDPVKSRQAEFRLVETGDKDTKRIFHDFTTYFHAERSKRCHTSSLKVPQTVTPPVEENHLPSAGQVIQQNVPVVQSAVPSVCSQPTAPPGNPPTSDCTSPNMAVPSGSPPTRDGASPNMAVTSGSPPTGDGTSPNMAVPSGSPPTSDGTSPNMAVTSGSPPTRDGTSPILAVQSAITASSHTSNHVTASTPSEKSELTVDRQSSSPHVTHSNSPSVSERTLLQETTYTVAASSEKRSAETSHIPNCNQPALVSVSQPTTNRNEQQQSSRPSRPGQLNVGSDASLTYFGNGPGQSLRNLDTQQNWPTGTTKIYIPIAAPQGIPVIIPSSQSGSTATQNVNYSRAMEQIKIPGVVEPVQPTSNVQSRQFTMKHETSPTDTVEPRSMLESAKKERWQKLVSEMCALANIKTSDSGLNMVLLANVLKMEGLNTVNQSVLRMARNRVAKANRECMQQPEQQNEQQQKKEQEHRQQQQQKELQRMKQNQQLLHWSHQPTEASSRSCSVGTVSAHIEEES